MFLPEPRGPVSTAVVRALLQNRPELVPDAPAHVSDALVDEDLQLTLWICFELHYRGFEDVEDTWEWSPELIRLRTSLEEHVLTELRRRVAVEPSAEPVPDRLRAVIEADDGPSLARELQTRATRAQFEEFAIHRSLYQLKEADPHSFAIPRLSGRSKVALVEIQTDEYGAGRPSRMHSELFRTLLRGVGLDDTYGHYLDSVPGLTLSMTNVMSLFALRRSLRGALVGHLAAYEMTSSGPCRRYARGLRRLGGDDDTCAFFDEHVTADALHEQVAAHDMCGGLAEAEPELTEDIVFGAAACLYMDRLFAEHVLGAWARGRSSLRSASDARLTPIAV